MLEVLQKKKTNIELNEINIDSLFINNSNNMTDEQISFVNKFNVFMSNNGIIIENNIPISNDINGQKNIITRLAQMQFECKPFDDRYIRWSFRRKY